MQAKKSNRSHKGHKLSAAKRLEAIKPLTLTANTVVSAVTPLPSTTVTLPGPTAPSGKFGWTIATSKTS